MSSSFPHTNSPLFGVILTALLAPALLAALPGCKSDTFSEDVARKEAVLSKDFIEEPAPGQPKPRQTLAIPQAHVLAESASQTGLDIYVFDLGQADSMLIVGPPPGRRTLLVDLGEAMAGGKPEGSEENYVRVANRILEITGKPHLDYFLVSHYHSDHIGSKNLGIAGLLNSVEPQFTIDTVVHAGSAGAHFMKAKRAVYDAFLENLNTWTGNHTVKHAVIPHFGTGSIDLGAGVNIDIVAMGGKVSSQDPGALQEVVDQGQWADRYKDAPASENDLSIAFKLSYKEFELFSAGDLTGYDAEEWDYEPLFTPRSYGGDKKETYTNVESHLVRHWKDTNAETDVEVYRVNHHGSRYSTSPGLLQALDPEVAIYSCGGLYSHPEKSTIGRVHDTADQLLTTRPSTDSKSTFQSAGGEVAGEIHIAVALDGSAYAIGNTDHRTFSNAEEAAGADEAHP